MSSIESAMADVSNLSTYQGQPVLAVAAALTGAGDGLSKALSVKPVELKFGEEVYVLAKASVEKHRHEPIDKDNPSGPLRLVLMLRADTMTLVDAQFAAGKIQDQERLIREAQEAAKGIVPIPEVVEAEKVAMETGRKAPPSAPVAGPTDEDGFHDPAMAAASGATPISKARARKAKD